jgi:hypothetical protein
MARTDRRSPPGRAGADAGMPTIIRLAAVHLRIVYGEGKIFINY